MGTFALAAYLSRSEYTGPRRPELENLRALHLARATHVPFENLNIQMGRLTLLDLPSLEDKLVRCRRGGYCFEQNTLFLEVLQALGFDAIACAARVRLRMEGQLRPRAPMVLVVELGGASHLCDVGFGGDGLLLPLTLDGAPYDEYGGTLRADSQASGVVLRQAQGDGWEGSHACVPEARYPIDFTVANWFSSTHPDGVFVKTLPVQRAPPAAARELRD
jgi:N-hydroxyarylamine O-acetyltransferase